MRQITYGLITASLLTASAFAIAAPTATPAPAAPAAAPMPLQQFTPAQQQELKEYVTDYIMENPQVIVASVQRMQAQQQMQQAAAGKVGAIANAAQLVQDKYSPTIHQGTVTVVEFFDYQCSVCHMVQPAVAQFIHANSNVRVVFKAFPIFGPASQYAAQTAIAASMQGQAKYMKFHMAMFKSNLMEGKLKDSDVDAIARKSGLNMAMLKKDMQMPFVNAEIKSTFQLAQELHLVGTPAFVVMPTDINNKAMLANTVLIPGGTDLAGLEQAVAKVKG